MYLTPVPGCDRKQLIDTLRTIQNSVINVRSQSMIRSDLLLHYSIWASEAVRLLRGKVREADLDRLILSRRYWALQASTASIDIGTIVDLEIDERRAALDAAVGELEEEQRLEISRPGHVVIADTNVFLEHPEKLESLGFAGMLGLRETPVRLIIPIVVIDELDGLKTHRARKHVPWRASYTLAYLDGLLDATGYGTIREADFSAFDAGGIPRGRVTAEISFDPPGHVRLANNDDEIVDRAMAIQAYVGREITLVTYDTKMRLRARTAGLSVHKLEQRPGSEGSLRSS